MQGFEWSYRDLLWSTVVVFMAMAILAVVAVVKQTADAAVSPGNIMVQLWWDRNVDADVDLWVQAPGERPVGYSNKGGVTFNLLRDDLGKTSDEQSRNYELAVGRGIPAGEYTINARLYTLRSAGPVPCRVTVTLASGASPMVIADQSFTLTALGEEQTAIRFRLDESHGASGFNRLPRALRSSAP